MVFYDLLDSRDYGPAFGLRALGEERIVKRLICVSLEPRARHLGDVTILPCGEFLDELWAGEYRR